MSSDQFGGNHRYGGRVETRWLAAIAAAIVFLLLFVGGREVYHAIFDHGDDPRLIPSALRGAWHPVEAPSGLSKAVPSPGEIELDRDLIKLGDGTMLQVNPYMSDNRPDGREIWFNVIERETEGMALHACGRNPVDFVVAYLADAPKEHGAQLELMLYAGRFDRIQSDEPPIPCMQSFYSR